MATHQWLSKNINSAATCKIVEVGEISRSQMKQNKIKQPTNLPSQIQVRTLLAYCSINNFQPLYYFPSFFIFCLLFQIMQIIIIHMDMMTNHETRPRRVVQNFLLVDFGGCESVVSLVSCCASTKKAKETSSRLQTLSLMAQSYNLEQRYSVTESRLPAADLHID